jgi:DNA-binding MarR family transcriptional regulator
VAGHTETVSIPMHRSQCIGLDHFLTDPDLPAGCELGSLITPKTIYFDALAYPAQVQAVELFLLGRKLMKLGEEAIPPSKLEKDVAATVRLVAIDVQENPGSSVREITERTGFPQSQVSMSVAKLRQFGAVVTMLDPADRRRTLVMPVKAGMERGNRHAAVQVDEAIAEAIPAGARDRLHEVLAALELLSEVMIPEAHRLAPSS